MRHESSASLTLAFLGIVLAAGCGVVSAQTVIPCQAGVECAGWELVATETRALALEAIEEGAPAPSLTSFVLKNVSGKAIRGFILTLGGATDSFYSRGVGPDGLPPGTTDTYIASHDALSRVTKRTIEVRAVLFEDGTSEGARKFVDDLDARFAGMMLETDRIRNILDVPANQYLTDAGLNALRERIGQVPKMFEEARASLEGVSLPGLSVSSLNLSDKQVAREFGSGVSAIREGALRKIDALRSPPPGIRGAAAAAVQRDRATRLQQEYRRLSEKNRAYCERRQGGRS